jgi:hypothetical protein
MLRFVPASNQERATSKHKARRHRASQQDNDPRHFSGVSFGMSSIIIFWHRCNTIGSFGASKPVNILRDEGWKAMVVAGVMVVVLGGLFYLVEWSVPRCDLTNRLRGRAAEQRKEEATLHLRGHSMTSSASDKRLSEIFTPSAFAVLRLITSSNFATCITGSSAGFSSLRICAV